MAKYIIDIPDDRVCDYVGSTHLLMPYTMAGHKGHHDTGLKLTPYTEPDCKAIEDAQEEAWKMASKCLWDITNSQSRVIFGMDCVYVPRDLLYQEAKARYEAWKEQIRVGDEVQACEHGLSSVVVGIAYGSANLLYDGGALGQAPINELIKTGRHFSQVADLLKAMKGE